MTDWLERALDSTTHDPLKLGDYTIPMAAPLNRELVRQRTIRDLNWLERLVKDYRNGLEGKSCQHSLQDIELVVKEMRERLDALGKQGAK
jgi:hypothetical protein